MRTISKLIEQLVLDNNHLENEVRTIKLQDIPLIKQFLNQRSVVTEKQQPSNFTAASTISQFAVPNKNKTKNEFNESNIGVSYYQRYPGLHESNINIRVSLT